MRTTGPDTIAELSRYATIGLIFGTGTLREH